MKLKLIIILILFTISLQALTIGASASARKNIDYIFDYEFAFEISQTDFIYAEWEIERENGKNYFNQEYKLTLSRSFLTSNAKLYDVESKSINMKQIDLRAVYSVFSLGIANQWNENIPTTKIIAGIRYNKTINNFKIDFTQDILTKDFQDFDFDVRGVLEYKFKRFTLYWNGSLKDYVNSDWQVKAGIKVLLRLTKKNE